MADLSTAPGHQTLRCKRWIAWRTWQISGDAIGTVTYRWYRGILPAPRRRLELFGHKTRFTEIIGRHGRSEANPAPRSIPRVHQRGRTRTISTNWTATP